MQLTASWIPAFAGMTIPFIRRTARARTKCSRANSAHSTASDVGSRQFPQTAFMQFQHAVQLARQAAVVGHQHQAGLLCAVEFQHQLEYGRGGLLVQVAGGFVAEHAGGLVDQRTRDGGALALAAGKLARLVLDAMAQADVSSSALARCAAAFTSAPPSITGIITFSSAVNSGSRWWNW